MFACACLICMYVKLQLCGALLLFHNVMHFEITDRDIKFTCCRVLYLKSYCSYHTRLVDILISDNGGALSFQLWYQSSKNRRFRRPISGYFLMSVVKTRGKLQLTFLISFLKCYWSFVEPDNVQDFACNFWRILKDYSKPVL